jgi:predicted phage baseplate assembly protein
MPLPEPILDDLRFQQDLVDEARRRIIRYCPEWTDYNLSDPGITLIELFAWMTEMITYRLNQVPEKNYLKFIELLGLQLLPASSARTEVTFYLSTRLPLRIDDDTSTLVPQGTEVSTRRTDEEPEVIFTTDERLDIVPPILSQLRRAEDFQKNYLPRMGVELFYGFNQQKPQPGDTFYLGFDPTHDIKGHILQLAWECEETQATGIRRDDPPLVWEVTAGNGQWEEVFVSRRQDERDTTGGLNNPFGQLIIYLPLTMKADQVHGLNALWLRCRLEQRHKEQGMYTQSPRIKRVEAYTRGATTRATNAVFTQDERLGYSTGEPAQTYRLEHSPILALRDDETVEVEEQRNGEIVFIPWKRVNDFSVSDRFDRHYTLDNGTGEVTFGPSVRQPDGSVRQYGRIPDSGREIRFSQYRYGGGVAGNVPVSKIQVLTSATAYVAYVTNLVRAEGGRDQESIEEAKMRARRELRAQQRAVTANDYEDLARAASRSIARVKCTTSHDVSLPPGMVDLLIVPAAFDALRAGDLSRLRLEDPLRKDIERFISPYRLLTTTVRIGEPKYIGIKVAAEVVVNEYSDPEQVKERVSDALTHFIAPLNLDEAEPPAADATIDRSNGNAVTNSNRSEERDGWPFGRDLYVSEVYSLVQNVRGVKHVRDVKLSQRPVIPAKETLARRDEPLSPELEAYRAVRPADQRRIEVPDDTLLVSLNHEVTVVEL